MNFYLCIGLVIAVLLAYRSTLPMLAITCLYWLITTLWAIGLIDPFLFTSITWVKLFNINISYQVDGLSHLFAVLIGGIGVVVFIYSWLYTEQSAHQRPKLLSLLQLFAISMLGIVLADDMIMLYTCWELTSISSYLLIQFDVKDKEANQAAFNSLFVSALGGLILLVGFILLNQLTGSWSINHVVTELLSNKHDQLRLPFYLILFGAITKSAQFPFYFWLTGAMKAPTPVSAYLHSATMVNAGIYLLARLHPLFSTVDVWYPVLSAIGLITMTISSILSLFQRDLKAILAYTTIFALGTMVYILGGVNTLIIEAFAVFLLFHGIYKAGAFMLVGIIDQHYHSRQLDQIAGIGRSDLLLGISAMVIFGAMAGIPPFFGFTVKEIIYEGKLASSSTSQVFMSISMVSSMFIAATSFRCLWFLFKPGDTMKAHHSSKNKSKLIFICPTILTVFIIMFSVFDQYTKFLIEPVLQTLTTINEATYISPNTKASFLLSLLTSVGGLALILMSYLIKMPPWSWFKWLELKTAFESGFNGFLIFGKTITQLTQGQKFINQLRIFFTSIIIISVITLTLQPVVFNLNIYNDANLIINVICSLLLLTSFSLLVSSQFLYNLISLALIGLIVSVFFIVNAAVDVAITQLLVEVLTIIVLLIVLRTTEMKADVQNKKNKLINAVIALSSGCIAAYILSSLQEVQFSVQLQNFYINNSLISAHGKNVVNVILVDFRSLDTFGEAMVIVSTAIGAILLLKKYLASKRKNHVGYH